MQFSRAKIHFVKPTFYCACLTASFILTEEEDAGSEGNYDYTDDTRLSSNGTPVSGCIKAHQVVVLYVLTLDCQEL